MKHTKNDIKKVLTNEIVAFNLSENLSHKDILALDRRLDLIAKAIVNGGLLPKPSKRFYQSLAGATDCLNFTSKKLRLVK